MLPLSIIGSGIFYNLQAVGCGIVLRDNLGDVLMIATNIRKKGLQDPETMECLAILRGIQLCLPFGIFNLVVESDCQIVILELQKLELSHSRLGNIIQDIKLLMNRFQYCVVWLRHG